MSDAFVRQVSEAAVRLTGKRWCSKGFHWAPAEGGKWRQSGKSHVKMYTCAGCLKKSKT